ncbi:MAG: SusC/RagA family TonB-linked outer membrane protein [Bacteroidota bacterium]|nr:SusC/RagA family TonB-linked outer membrane protein [Bacteroidota bacterium]
MKIILKRRKNLAKWHFFLSYFLVFGLLLVSSSLYAQNSQISGTVKDSNGAPLPGVSVMVQGTKFGTVTNPEGIYSIKAPSNATLKFSFIGMKGQSISVAGKSKINVTMMEDAKSVDEVVVTALGIKRSEKALGYSVQKVSGESLQKVSGVDVTTSLTGKVAGLLVKNSPDFGVTPVLSIRGETPLLVIDGVAYANKTLSDISSEDIESMSVLKGATASALYGFRGANGAILVTTKNGSANKGGLTAEFTTNTMFTAGFLAIPEKQSVYGRGSNNTYDKNSDSSWGQKMDGSIQNQWDPNLMEYRDYAYLPVGKNNFKNFLEQGYVTNNNFNVGYKKENVSLRSSINWTENKGQYPNSKLDKFTYTFGGDINLDKFKLSSNLSYAKKHTPNLGSNGYTSYDPMYSLLIWSGSDFNILDYKNNYWLKKGEVQNYTYRSGSNNPYFDRYERTNEVSRDIFNADVSSSYQIAKWLKASLRSGLDFYTDRGDQRVSWGSYTSTGNTGIPGNPWTWNGAWTGCYNTGQNQGFSMNSDFLLTGDKSISKFVIDYLAGGTIYYKKDDNIYANTVGGISVPGFFSLKASVNTPYVSQSTEAEQVNSLYGRVSLSWNNMAFLEATGRNDWSSTLPETTRSYFYPSVAGSFVVSELMPGTKDWLDLLKVRSSWTMSKTPPEIYAVNSAFTINSGTWGTMNGASAPSNLYGSNILPESANTFEVGLQGMVLKDRLMVDLSYYDKHMYDFLEAATLSGATGYTGNYINTDEEISRRGWEVAVNGSPIKNKDWQWDLGGNWSTYKRVYTKLDATYSSKKPWVKVGERVDALVSKDFVRDPSGNLVFNNGRLQYSQYDSNFGWTDPDWIWGLNTTLRYKNFSLFASFDGVVGGLMNTRTESYMWQAGVHPKSLTKARELDVATPGSKNFIGQGVKVVSGTATYDQDGNITSDTRVFEPNDVATTYKQYIIDLHNSSAWGGAGSPADTYSKTFFKLRELSLTYNVPSRFLHGIAKATSISFVGQNVFLWAKDFKYSDPDGGIEDFSDPSVRYLGGNIKVTF